jgi:hypothetical protein
VTLSWETKHGDTVRVFPRIRPWHPWQWDVRLGTTGVVIERGLGYAERTGAVDAAVRHHPPRH